MWSALAAGYELCSLKVVVSSIPIVETTGKSKILDEHFVGKDFETPHSVIPTRSQVVFALLFNVETGIRMSTKTSASLTSAVSRREAHLVYMYIFFSSPPFLLCKRR